MERLLICVLAATQTPCTASISSSVCLLLIFSFSKHITLQSVTDKQVHELSGRAELAWLRSISFHSIAANSLGIAQMTLNLLTRVRQICSTNRRAIRQTWTTEINISIRFGWKVVYTLYWGDIGQVSLVKRSHRSTILHLLLLIIIICYVLFLSGDAKDCFRGNAQT